MIGWWVNKNHKLWLKGTALALAVTFLYTTIASPMAEASIWEQRRNAFRQKPLEKEKSETSPFDPIVFRVSEPSFRVPSNAGAIIQTYRGKPDTPLLVHIQDIMVEIG